MHAALTGNRRRAALVVGLLLVAGACSPDHTARSGPDGAGRTGPPTSETAGGAGTTTLTSSPGPSGSNPSTRPRSATTRRSGAAGPTAPPATRGSGSADLDVDVGRLGTLSRSFLRPAPYTKVAVQMDHAGSFTPSGAVTGRVTGVLGKYTNKPVIATGGHRIPGRSCWTIDDVVNAEDGNRQVHTRDSTVSLYVLFADGTFCDDDTYLGFAYRASSIVIFGAASQRLGTPTVPGDEFTKAVVTHELGHVFGLVNLVYESKVDHEDPSTEPGHRYHSANKRSVMYYLIDNRNLIVEFVSGPPQNFDADDEADLRGLADGTY